MMRNVHVEKAVSWLKIYQSTNFWNYCSLKLISKNISAQISNKFCRFSCNFEALQLNQWIIDDSLVNLNFLNLCNICWHDHITEHFFPYLTRRVFFFVFYAPVVKCEALLLIFVVYWQAEPPWKNNSRRGYLVSGLIFVSRKYLIYWHILLYTFPCGKRSV